MKQDNYRRGKAGEEIAAEYLRRKGFGIIEKNFRTRYGEIDLVCSKEKRLVFVEVKLKIGEDCGKPEEMISENKVRKIIRTAESYLVMRRKIADKYEGLRVDVVAIVMGEGDETKRISHYENVTF